MGVRFVSKYRAKTWRSGCFKKKSIDFSKKKIYIKGNCIRVRTQDPNSTYKTAIIEQDRPKTDNAFRSVSLNKLAIKAINELWVTSEGSPYLIVSKNGNFADRGTLDRQFRRILRNAGFDESKIYGVHSLRHSFATGLINKGVNVKVIAGFLGHGDVATTLQTYTHVFDDGFADAVARLDDVDFNFESDPETNF